MDEMAACHMRTSIAQSFVNTRRYARCPKNPMVSIKNHYILFESSNANRLSGRFQEWSAPAARSTSAGHAARSDSSDRSDRMVNTLGAGSPDKVTDEELEQLLDLWAADLPEYGRFRQKYNA